jgi:hypothetical protein
MATITKPMALDETFNTTETMSLNCCAVIFGYPSEERRSSISLSLFVKKCSLTSSLS